MAVKLIHIYHADSRKHGRLLAGGLFLCVILVAAAMAFRRPAYNWDILPYMAVVVREASPAVNMATIHRLTYGEAKREIPAPAYAQLTGNSTGSYRKKMAADAAAFYRQLPFYLVKPLYTAAALGFYKTGFSLPVSTVLPSLLGYILTAVLLFYWISRYLSGAVAVIASLLLMLSPPLLDMARSSGPDALSAFLLFAALYFILEKRSFIVAFLWLLLALLSRIDNILICILLFSFLFFRKKEGGRLPLWAYPVLLLPFAAVYILVCYPVVSFGWNILYYPSFISHLNAAHDLDATPSFGAYLALARGHLEQGLFHSHLVLFFLTAGLILMKKGRKDIRQLDEHRILILLLAAVIVIRFILYPDISDRFYIFFYLSAAILLIKSFLPSPLPEYERKQ